MIYAGGLVLFLFGAGTIPPVVVASSFTAVAAVIAAIFGLVGNRRGSRDSRSIGLIEQAQEWTQRQLTELRTENEALRLEVRELRPLRAEVNLLRPQVAAMRAELGELRPIRGQVAAMRLELAESLRHHQECENMRAALERVIEELSDQVRRLTGGA